MQQQNLQQYNNRIETNLTHVMHGPSKYMKLALKQIILVGEMHRLSRLDKKRDAQESVENIKIVKPYPKDNLLSFWTFQQQLLSFCNT